MTTSRIPMRTRGLELFAGVVLADDALGSRGAAEAHEGSASPAANARDERSSSADQGEQVRAPKDQGIGPALTGEPVKNAEGQQRRDAIRDRRARCRTVDAEARDQSEVRADVERESSEQDQR